VNEQEFANVLDDLWTIYQSKPPSVVILLETGECRKAEGDHSCVIEYFSRNAEYMSAYFTNLYQDLFDNCVAANVLIACDK